jgi:SAM-dependent methyltransferase
MRDNGTVVETSLWMQKVERDPGHSTWFVQRFRDKVAAGEDIAGEARLIDAMAPRRARVLDAGCGTGRVGGELAQRGHNVIGVDVDPVLIDAARQDHPGGTWLVGDLAELDPAQLGSAGGGSAGTRCAAADAAGPDPVEAAPGGERATHTFDVIVAAGNVMPFLAPSTRRPVLANLRAAMAPGGRAAIGFGEGRGYPFDEFLADVTATGWTLDATFAGWDLHPLTPASVFLVALLSSPSQRHGPSVDGAVAPMPPLTW